MDKGNIAFLILIVWVACIFLSLTATRPFIQQYRDDEDQPGFLEVAWYLGIFIQIYVDVYDAACIAIREPDAKIPPATIGQAVLLCVFTVLIGLYFMAT